MITEKRKCGHNEWVVGCRDCFIEICFSNDELRKYLGRLKEQIQKDWDNPDCRTLTQQINAAPRKLRTYIHDVVTRASTADLVQDNIALKDTADALKIENDKLETTLDLFVDAAEKVEQADKLSSTAMLKLACVFVLKTLDAYRKRSGEGT